MQCWKMLQRTATNRCALSAAEQTSQKTSKEEKPPTNQKLAQLSHVALLQKILANHNL